MARTRWRQLGARGIQEAKGFFRGQLRRSWGCAAIFAAAHNRVARLRYVGRSRALAAREVRPADDADYDPRFGATAFEADEAGVGVMRMARGAPTHAV